MTKRNQMNHDIMTGWLENHPEHKELVSIMQAAGQAFADNLKAEMFGNKAEANKETSIVIAVGKAAEKAFYPYLQSTLKNPRIVLGSICKYPQIVITEVHTIELSKIEGVKVQTESIKEGDYSFERYTINYRLHDLDYMVSVVIKSK